MNKGFTLIETIMTIVILSVVMLIAMPVYNEVSETVREVNYNSKIKSIESAMLKFANIHLLDEIKPENKTNHSLNFTVDQMIEYNIIAAEEYDENHKGYIKNPITNRKLKGYVELTFDLQKVKVNAKFRLGEA